MDRLAAPPNRSRARRSGECNCPWMGAALHRHPASLAPAWSCCAPAARSLATARRLLPDCLTLLCFLLLPVPSAAPACIYRMMIWVALAVTRSAAHGFHSQQPRRPAWRAAPSGKAEREAPGGAATRPVRLTGSKTLAPVGPGGAGVLAPPPRGTTSPTGDPSAPSCASPPENTVRVRLPRECSPQSCAGCLRWPRGPSL